MNDLYSYFEKTISTNLYYTSILMQNSRMFFAELLLIRKSAKLENLLVFIAKFDIGNT